MKKELHRLLAIVIIAISILAITQMAVYAQDKNKVSLLKTSEESYIIYIPDNTNTEFLFCFSDNSEVNVEDLVFSASGLDSNEVNVAYMDKEIAESFTEGKAHMWVQVNEEVEEYEINLNEAVTQEEITLVNTTTKRIEVNTQGEEKTSENIEGVKITHSQGKITLKEKGETFSYYMQKVEDDKTTNLIQLSNKIINSKELSNYERVNLVREFTDTYTEMFEGIEKWEQVPEDKVILQPQESKKDDIYIVWLRNNETQEHDIQILICDDKQDIEVEEEKKVTVYDVTKLPVTYDTVMTLIIALIVIIATIVALLIIKKKENKEEN